MLFRSVEILEQMVPGMQEKILSGQFKVRDADMHRLARADFPNREQIVHEILHPEDRPAPQKSGEIKLGNGIVIAKGPNIDQEVGGIVSN